ncbi:hypothetical protein EW145_g7926 [Phellinidium pouzarii]|uniref:General transcription and DNA repair factor IIH subunit TFB5 n=1 Tax=Phellinidium pouzarii TaxID=167371 RepID=A0A4S4KCE7_9AGAM|nr:hypothetical protein EW145_g7926 [Phellinidium pouzarii]
MKAIKGVLLTWCVAPACILTCTCPAPNTAVTTTLRAHARSDSAVKQILLTMNEKSSFVIEDLDDFHLVIKADEEYRVRKQLETELEKNTYSLDQQ